MAIRKTVLSRVFLLFFTIAILPSMLRANKLNGHPFAVSRQIFFEEEEDFRGGEFERTLFHPGRGMQISPLFGDDPSSGSYLSPEIRSPFPMTEILPSWNVDVPTSTGFSLYIRVSETGGDWSPWLFLGRDGETPPDLPRKTSWKGAELDVDYVLFSKPHRFLRWKVELYRDRTGNAPCLRLFSLALGNASGNKEIYDSFAGKPRKVDGWNRRLNVPYRSQLSDDPEIPPRMRGAICCPVSVAMVLDYYGRRVSTRKVCDLCFDRDYRIWGVWPRASQTLSRFGLRSHIVQIREFDEIGEYIAGGVPLIISIRAYRGELHSAPYTEAPGHILVITGLAGEDAVWVNDPYNTDGEKGPTRWTREEIGKVFIDRGGVAIIARPR